MEAVINMVNGIYEASLGLTIEIVFSNVWECEPDPFESTDVVKLLKELRRYWRKERSRLRRDAALLFTGKELDNFAAGAGFVSTACRKRRAFALTMDPGSDATRSIVAAHELGHVLGATHDPVDSWPQYLMHPYLSLDTLDELSARSEKQIARRLARAPCIDLVRSTPGSPERGE